MGAGDVRAGDEGVGARLSDVVEALGAQLELHVELAKAELSRDARALVRDLLPLAAGLMCAGVAYVFACLAVALTLAIWLGAPGGVAIVGGLNLLGAAIAIRRSLRRLQIESLVSVTVGAELQQSARDVASVLKMRRSGLEMVDV